MPAHEVNESNRFGSLPTNLCNDPITAMIPMEAPGGEVLGNQWLDATDDEYHGELPPTVGTIVMNLIKDAKCHKSFAALFKLQAVKYYLELLLKYSQNAKINNPRTRASLAVAKSVGKGPYFARKIRHLKLYIEHFRTLPPTSSGKHVGHPSLLNDERVAHAVRRYLTAVPLGDVSA